MIEKRYKDIDAGWFVPDQGVAVYQLGWHYRDTDIVLAKMKAGDIIETRHAWYRWVPDEKQEDTDGRRALDAVRGVLSSRWIGWPGAGPNHRRMNVGMGGAYQDAFEKERKHKAEVKAEALAAEDTAVCNLDLIRKLEARAGILEDYHASGTEIRASQIKGLQNHIDTLEHSLADARSDNVLLTRLAERIGYIVEILAARDDSLEQFAHGTDLSNLLSPDYPFTVFGQREYDAAGPNHRRMNVSTRMTSYGISQEEAHMIRMTPEEIARERVRMDLRTKTNRLTARVVELECKVEALKTATGALSELITWTEELLRAEDALLAGGLEMRIKHLEAVVYDEGPLPTRESEGL